MERQQGLGGGEQEEAAEILSVDHFPPAADTSSDATNEGSRGGRERVCGGVEAEARRGRRAMASRLAALRGRAAGREDYRAAVRIQAFYRGYLVRNVSQPCQKFFKNAHDEMHVREKIEMHFPLKICQSIL